MDLTLQPYRNGKYVIHNVPYERDDSGNFYLPSNTLKQLAELIEIMAKENVNELDFGTSFKTDFNSKTHLYKSAANFELLNLNYYKRELEKTTNDSKLKELKVKIQLLEDALDLLDLPSKELISRKYLGNKKLKDQDVINTLNINRNTYYSIKQEALLRIGRYLYGELKGVTL